MKNILFVPNIFFSIIKLQGAEELKRSLSVEDQESTSQLLGEKYVKGKSHKILVFHTIETIWFPKTKMGIGSTVNVGYYSRSWRLKFSSLQNQ